MSEEKKSVDCIILWETKIAALHRSLYKANVLLEDLHDSNDRVLLLNHIEFLESLIVKAEQELENA